MYGGETVEVVLEFRDNLIGAVYDKFGEDVKMTRVANDKCTAAVKIQVSPVFWGWLFQFGKQMRIIFPEALTDEYRLQINKLVE